MKRWMNCHSWVFTMLSHQRVKLGSEPSVMLGTAPV